MGYMAVVEPSGNIRRVQTEEFKLEDFQKEVGGLICTAGTKVSEIIAVVDDEGLLKGYEPNWVASSITGQPLFGNTVFGIIDGEDIIPFPEEFNFEWMANYFTRLWILERVLES